MFERLVRVLTVALAASAGSVSAATDYCLYLWNDSSFTEADTFELKPGEEFDIAFVPVRDGVFVDMPECYYVDHSEIDALVSGYECSCQEQAYTGPLLFQINPYFTVKTTARPGAQGRLLLKDENGKVLKTVTIRIKAAGDAEYVRYDWNTLAMHSSDTFLVFPGDELFFSFVKTVGGDEPRYVDLPEGCYVDASEVEAFVDQYESERVRGIQFGDENAVEQLCVELSIKGTAAAGSRGRLYLKDAAGVVLDSVTVGVQDRSRVSYCLHETYFRQDDTLVVELGEFVSGSLPAMIGGAFVDTPSSYWIDWSGVKNSITRFSGQLESRAVMGSEYGTRNLVQTFEFTVRDDIQGSPGGCICLRDDRGEVVKTIWLRIVVPYVDANGWGRECDSFEFLKDSTEELRGGCWYVVRNGYHIRRGSLRVKGMSHAHLILCNGGSLEVEGVGDEAGIKVEASSRLTIYGQSNAWGELLAVAKGSGAGIGGGAGSACGSVDINGGIVTARSEGGGAGIGGGAGAGILDQVVINGGSVAAYGGPGDGVGSGGAGIGGGDMGDNGLVVINGGSVTAVGGGDAQGIGAGVHGRNSASGIFVAPHVVFRNGDPRFDPVTVEHGKNGAVDSTIVGSHVTTEVPEKTSSYAIGYGHSLFSRPHYEECSPGAVFTVPQGMPAPFLVPGDEDVEFDGWVGSDGKVYDAGTLVFDAAVPGFTLFLSPKRAKVNANERR